MTTTNTPTETVDIRDLSADETDDISGAMTFATWIRRLAWQLERAPANSTLIGCSDDLSACSWQSN